MHKIAIIGTGNVAFHLAKHLTEKNHQITVVSRSQEKGEQFLKAIGITLPLIYPPDPLPSNFGFIILAVPDRQIIPVLEKHSIRDAILLHAAGAQPIGILEAYAETYGVFYPFQTFTKEKEIDFTHIPILIEGSDEATLREIKKLALELSTKVHSLSSDDRLKIHLAAVFASNFSNHLFGIAGQLLEGSTLSLNDFSHLIKETANKALAWSPQKAQTGPAIRKDQEVMRKHMALLKDPQLKALYQLHSEMISKSMED